MYARNILRYEPTSRICSVLFFASLLLIVSSVTNVKVTAQSNGTNAEKPTSEKTFTRGPSANTMAGANCPAEEVKDYTGICSKESEAKACPTYNPGSAAVPEIMAEYQSDKIVPNPNELQSDKAKLQSDVIQVKNDIINLQPEATQVKSVLQSNTAVFHAPSGGLENPSIQQSVAKLQAQQQNKVQLVKLQSDTAKLQSDENKYSARSPIPALAPQIGPWLQKFVEALGPKKSPRGCQMYSFTQERCLKWHPGYHA